MNPVTVSGIVLLVSALSARGQIVLNEIMFDPAGPESSDEFVEILNLSDTEPVNLFGWRIGDGTGEDLLQSTSGGLILQPGQYGLIVDADYLTDSNTYDGLIPDDALVLTISGTTLGSGGFSNSTDEEVILFRSNGTEAARAVYSTGNAPGHSDEKIDAAGSDTPDNWADSRTLHGTPGFANSVARLAHDLAFRRLEATPNPSPFGQDIMLEAHLFNVGSASAESFGVCFFVDTNGDSIPQTMEEIRQIDINEAIAAGDSMVVSTLWIAPVPGMHTIGALAEYAPDQRSDNDFEMIVAVVGFPSATLVINEIMADPLAGDAEWVELFNPHLDPVNLCGWTLSDADTLHPVRLTEENVGISSGGFVVLAADSSVADRYPVLDGPLLVPQSFPGLNNAGDRIVLSDPAGWIVDAVSYDASWGGGSGVSLERINPALASNDPANWSACAALEGGTPGRTNSVFAEALPSSAKLSVSPNPFSPDGDGMDDAALISYSLPTATASINLRIFDVRGRLVRTLRGAAPSGSQAIVVWDGKDDAGQLLRMGIYIIHLEGLNSSAGMLFSDQIPVVLAGKL